MRAGVSIVAHHPVQQAADNNHYHQLHRRTPAYHRPREPHAHGEPIWQKRLLEIASDSACSLAYRNVRHRFMQGEDYRRTVGRARLGWIA
jgi:hypothetical protein